MTQQTEIMHQDGDVIEAPLNKLKKSPRNARRMPHAVADIEALAASLAARISALSEEYDALVSEWDAVEELPPEIEARFTEIDAALEAFGDGTAFDPDEIARGGAFVILGQDGVAPALSGT